MLCCIRRPAAEAEAAGAAEAPLSVRGSVSISYGSDKVDIAARSNTAAEELAAVASMLFLFGYRPLCSGSGLLCLKCALQVAVASPCVPAGGSSSGRG